MKSWQISSKQESLAKKQSKQQINIFAKKSSACLTRTKNICFYKNKNLKLLENEKMHQICKL